MMKTKVTVLGEEPKEKELKPIYLIYGMCDRGKLKPNAGIRDLKQYNEVVLLERHYFDNGDDLIFCKHKDPNLSCLFRGKWNDGVIYTIDRENPVYSFTNKELTIDLKCDLPILPPWSI